MARRVMSAAIVAMGLVALAAGGEGPFKQADQLFEQKHYKEAAQAYEKVLGGSPAAEQLRHGFQQLVACKLRLRLFDQALAAAEQYIQRTAGTSQEARAQRMTGNLYMSVPHWGTRAGGKFHRAQHKQGIRLQSHRYDKRHALQHMEQARELYAKFDVRPAGKDSMAPEDRKVWHGERIECLFDLASVVSSFTIYESNWVYWYQWWGERDDERSETVGEDDFDEQQSHWALRRKRPIGLRVDPDGEPIFPSAGKEYSSDLGDDQKILCLLAEARELDQTDEGKYTALSWYRQAMLARTRFGMDRLNNYASYYRVGGQQPLKEELEDCNPWELKDGEALVLAGGRVRKTTLPEQFNILKLLRLVADDYKQSGVADQACYAIGLYYQSRQQYTQALTGYGRLKQAYAKSEWIKHADEHINRIKAPQVQLSQTGVQLPDEPAKLQLSYRNASKLWFVARKIDPKGFLEELRAELVKNQKRRNHTWCLANWHRYFMNKGDSRHWDQWIRVIAAKHVGEEVGRWSDEVEDDGSHRYAQATLQTPLKDRGAYLIYCSVAEPAADHAQKTGVDVFDLGNTRAVVVLTDLAYVEKMTAKGNLYFVADARGGAPVTPAKVSILEFWHERKGRRSVYRTKQTDLTTADNGTVLFARPDGRHSRVHLLISTEDNRIAWSGMRYWGRYSPSRMRESWPAYVITDRPVYRPEQTVRFKVWVRRMANGIYHNTANENFQIVITDPRGSKLLEKTYQADQYGGFDGDLALASEPPLGVYRLQVQRKDAKGRWRYTGGQNFRVEEYKKPEFEVSVDSGKAHLKLGEKVTAVIKAKYYFGAPVTDATVNYKVFREEYRHAYYSPGEWDWLYGVGYGSAWYDYDWFPWWDKLSCCRVAPPWWGWGPRYSAVRELVMEGTQPIGADGTVKLEIDTATVLRDHPDRDHRYVVKAEVRDASRRVITGEGSVKVTRQAFYAFVNSDRGYYSPGQEMEISVRCLTPGNEPVKTEGIVSISRIVFGGGDNARIEETEIKRWKAATDESGALTFRLRHERSDQLKIKFEAPDAWGGMVEGYGVVWVCGKDFDGKLYRFNNLELLTDKRSYEPGEVCHLMINTAHPDAYVIFSDNVDNNYLLSWKMLHLAKKHQIMDIPIKKEHRPNFFVEATTIADTRVHQQYKRICVPPEEGVMNVTVQTDKPEYRPGEKATVTVKAAGLDGQPVQAQIALSAFDKSVLYIQPEYSPDMKKFYHGRVRSHHLQMATNLTEQFSAWGQVARPFQQIHPVPPGWAGTWGPTVSDWRTVGGVELQRLEGGRGGGLAQRRNAKGFGEAKMANRAVVEDVVGMDKAKAAPPVAAGPGLPGGERKDAGAGGAEPSFAEAQVRQQFADTAIWLTTLTTDADGVVTATVDMPENLTTWKVDARGITQQTRVGQASAEAVTSKNLLVRLQAPRFFMEYDEVVISANVHNYLPKDKTARVSLEIPEELMTFMKGYPATVDVKVPAGGEHRVDWRVKVKMEGTAAITVKALTDEESDAMLMTFPVLVHGMMKHVATTGSMRPEDRAKTATVEIAVPEKRRPELTRLEVQFAPTLAGAMLDALPYCLDYPYKSSEATMSRFVPAVLTRKTLQNMGIKLEDLKNIRGRLAEIRRIEKGQGRTIYGTYADSPIFDTKKLDEIISKCLARITSMQHGDGGWGWWGRGGSSGYMTSYVLSALVAAQQCDVKIDENIIKRGMNFLKGWEEREMREKHWSSHTRHAFVAYVLSMRKIKAAIKPAKDDKRPGDCIERIFQDRDKLSLYGKALLSITLANVGDVNRARTVLRNIMQYKEENAETQLVWFRTPDQGWWYWWNNDIEANAWVLRAIVKLEPKSDVAPKLVKWLLENRRNGYYWRSTRDTAMCVAAMSDFIVASGEGEPDYTLTLDFDDGKSVKQVKISKDNFFTYDNRFVLEGLTLGGGKHTLKITKTGPGALYYSTYLSYFTKEEDIKAAGLQLKVQRRYYRLVQIPYEVEVEGSKGQKLKEKRLRYRRDLLKSGDEVKSGDLIQVELDVTSDNNYTYLVFEDMKAAGCEPVDVRSGGKSQEGFATYMELRDEKVVFFLGEIQQGTHLLRYRLRAETPGIFHALPTTLSGVYVPELRANSDELVLKIID